jgi:hypothetical protein
MPAPALGRIRQAVTRDEGRAALPLDAGLWTLGHPEQAPALRGPVSG